MIDRPTPYDQIAAGYNRRYQLNAYAGIWSTILSVLRDAGRTHVLEVGCGTGFWLAKLAAVPGATVAGIDPSTEMLRQAQGTAGGDLRQGVAEDLPWDDAAFDVVLCINALHHFEEPEAAIKEAFRALRPGGKFLSVGLDPEEGLDRWYVYDFFPEALARDRRRFASRDRRLSWLEAAGFTAPSVRIADRLCSSHRFPEALASGILERTFTSQLTALSDGEYAAGLQRLQVAADQDAGLQLQVDLTLFATEGTKPPAAK
ncbi:MAG: class I SAM-dependent methyltransferase [Polyangia bacterium]